MHWRGAGGEVNHPIMATVPSITSARARSPSKSARWRIVSASNPLVNIRHAVSASIEIVLVGGMFVALLGTAALMLGSTLSSSGDVTLFGVLLVTLSTMGWGIYTVVIRPVSRKYGSLQVACLAMAISALPMPFFVGVEFPQTLAGMGTTAWLSVGFVVVFGTFLATSAWNYALGHLESSIAGVFLYVHPVVAAIGGILLLNERLTWPLLAGGGLIILGVAISQFGPLMQKPRLASGARPASQRR